MDLQPVFDHFCSEQPMAVMARIGIEHAMDDKVLDEIFRQHAEQQYQGELLFSTIAQLMLPVSCRIVPSVRSAFNKYGDEIGVSLTSVYNKLNGLEPRVTRELVRQTAKRLSGIVEQLGLATDIPFPGYENRILDGHHLEGSHHRISETRKSAAAPLPGLGLVVLDPATELMLDYIAEEDAHTQERSLLIKIIDDLKSNQVWIADRNFCTAAFLWELHNAESFFVIRKHAQNVRIEPMGDQSPEIQGETGIISEQPIRILDDFGGSFEARRIRIVLNEKTRDGDQEIVLLSNLPPEVSMLQIASGYRDRWTIESAFGEIRRCLNGEINSLGYPKAALFSFSMALVAYNLLSVITSAIASEHGEEARARFSRQEAAQDISSISRGMEVILQGGYWSAHYRDRTPSQIAAELRRLAKLVDLGRYRKAKKQPHSPTPKRKYNPRKPHVATARLLANRNPK